MTFQVVHIKNVGYKVTFSAVFLYKVFFQRRFCSRPHAQQCSSNSLSLHLMYIFKILTEISIFFIHKEQKKVAEIVGSPNRFLHPYKRRHLGRSQCQNSVRCGRLLAGSVLMPFVPADVFATATLKVCRSVPSIFSRLERQQRRSCRCSC